ncbi:MAG: hypothetical protein MZV64_43785 [Ignavibacteriales bacterium]|nr:hypothetical protein [Ignavibacteriales bacterium]
MPGLPYSKPISFLAPSRVSRATPRAFSAPWRRASRTSSGSRARAWRRSRMGSRTFIKFRWKTFLQSRQPIVAPVQPAAISLISSSDVTSLW